LVTPPPGPWDDCFTDLHGPPVLSFEGGPVLTIESSCEHLVVYDERVEAVCVEPQTAPPDAPNLAPTVVEPGRPLVATMTLRFS
jgi:galactose mutarotase-like enzyme